MRIDQEEPLYTFYVDDEDQALVVCPSCSYEKRVHAGRFKDCKTSLKVRCQCGRGFRCTLESRRTFRKAVTLDAVCENLTSGGTEPVLICDLSPQGLGIRTYGGHDIHVGDCLELSFTLDDAPATRLVRRGVVTGVGDHYAGLRFKGEYTDFDLGAYLLA